MADPINVNTLANPIPQNELETPQTAPELGDAERSQNQSSIDKSTSDGNLKVDEASVESAKINISDQAQNILKSDATDRATNPKQSVLDLIESGAITKKVERERIDNNQERSDQVNVRKRDDNTDVQRDRGETRKENTEKVAISSNNRFFQVDTAISSLDLDTTKGGLDRTERNTAIPEDSIAAGKKDLLPERKTQALQKGENDIDPKQFIESVETQKSLTDKNNDAKRQNNLVLENTQQQRDVTKRVFSVKADIQQELEVINNKTLSEQQTNNKLTESNISDTRSFTNFAENNFVSSIRTENFSREIQQINALGEQNAVQTATTQEDTGFDILVTQRNTTIVTPEITATENIQVEQATPPPAPENINREENTQATLQVGLSAAESNAPTTQQQSLTEPNQVETADDVLGQTRQEEIGSQVNIKV